MITVQGLYGISATVLKHSISPQGVEFITYEIEYPRMVLAELNTHGMLVRNSGSSRAIPFAKMVEQLRARPVRFGAANKGMQDKGFDHQAMVAIPEYLRVPMACWLMEMGSTLRPVDFENEKGDLLLTGEWAWEFHKYLSLSIASAFNDAGYHKQVYNRLPEAHQMQKTVISGTEWNNFMWLRDHGAADPTIAELARVIKVARSKSKPYALKSGEWHLPYVNTIHKADGTFLYYIMDADDWEAIYLSLDDAIKVSAARCAAVSFRNEDYGVEKCREVFARLVGEDRKHASAFQHQGTPMAPKTTALRGDEEVSLVNDPDDRFTWEPGVSHVDRDGQLWSAQLRGWVMHRKLIDGENVPG